MAIAYDNSASFGTETSGTGFGSSYTCTGTAGLLVVTITGDTTTDRVSSVTYNSVGLTRLIKTNVGADAQYVYYLFGPSTGANTLTINTSADRAFTVSVASYTGVGGSAADASASGTGSAVTTITGSNTSIADNCWTIMCLGQDTADANAAGASTTLRTQRVGGGSYRSVILDSNALKTPAGSVSLKSDWTVGSNVAYSIFSIQPTIASTVTLAQGSFALTGFTLGMFVAHTLALAQGAYTLTGQALTLTLDLLWDNNTKNTSTMANVSKNTSSWANSSKNSSSMTNETKH